MTEMRLYTPHEVAERLGHISPYTIRRLVAQGRVTAIRSSRGKVLFSEELIAAMLISLTVQPAERPDEDPDDVWPGQTSR